MGDKVKPIRNNQSFYNPPPPKQGIIYDFPPRCKPFITSETGSSAISPYGSTRAHFSASMVGTDDVSTPSLTQHTENCNPFRKGTYNTPINSSDDNMEYDETFHPDPKQVIYAYFDSKQSQNNEQQKMCHRLQRSLEQQPFHYYNDRTLDDDAFSDTSHCSQSTHV